MIGTTIQVMLRESGIAGRLEIGDIVQAGPYPSLTMWGIKEHKAEWLRDGRAAEDRPGTFGLLFVTDLEYHEPLIREFGSEKLKSGGMGPQGLEEIEELEFRRRWHLDIPPALMATLRADGDAKVTADDLRGMLKHKVKNVPQTVLDDLLGAKGEAYLDKRAWDA